MPDVTNTFNYLYSLLKYIGCRDMVVAGAGLQSTPSVAHALCIGSKLQRRKRSRNNTTFLHMPVKSVGIIS
jgi:hypothetical protein